MIALKKIWVFLKTYWYIPVLIIVAVVLKSKSNRVTEILKIADDSHQKQLKAIEDSEKEKAQKKQQIEKEYNDAVTHIEKVFKDENKNLEERKKKEIKKIVKKYYNNPDEISSRISESFGLIYVPTENNSNSD